MSPPLLPHMSGLSPPLTHPIYNSPNYNTKYFSFISATPTKSVTMETMAILLPLKSLWVPNFSLYSLQTTIATTSSRLNLNCKLLPFFTFGLVPFYIPYSSTNHKRRSKKKLQIHHFWSNCCIGRFYSKL